MGVEWGYLINDSCVSFFMVIYCVDGWWDLGVDNHG